jgi:hypothetical protein
MFVNYSARRQTRAPQTPRSGLEKAHPSVPREVERRITQKYDIEVQPLKGASRHLVVDALDGLSWTADERRGSILDAGSLAEWLDADDVKENEAPEAARKKRQAVLALQARIVVDIIQIASKDPHVFYYLVGTRHPLAVITPSHVRWDLVSAVRATAVACWD